MGQYMAVLIITDNQIIILSLTSGILFTWTPEFFWQDSKVAFLLCDVTR